jgi:hypothetical protein
MRAIELPMKRGMLDGVVKKCLKSVKAVDYVGQMIAIKKHDLQLLAFWERFQDEMFRDCVQHSSRFIPLKCALQ